MADLFRVLIVLPNQLFYDSKGKKESSETIPDESPINYDHVYVIEHPSFFTNCASSKATLLRTWMKSFYNMLELPKTYVDYTNYNIKNICKSIHKLSPRATTIYIANPEDFDIFQEFDKIKYNLNVHSSRLFLIPFDEVIQDEHDDGKSFITFYMEKYSLVDIGNDMLKCDTISSPILDYCWDDKKKLVEQIVTDFIQKQMINISYLFTLANIGIITPWWLIDTIKTRLPSGAAHNLVCALLGREYYRAKYVKCYRKSIKSTVVECRPMSKSFSTGTTVNKAFNDIIRHLIDNGNPTDHTIVKCFRDITLLLQIRTQDVYDWLQTYLVNSYPWYIFGLVMTEFYCDSSVKSLYITPASGMQDTLKSIDSSSKLIASEWNMLVMNFIHTHDNLLDGDVRKTLWKKKKAKDKKIILDKAEKFITSI